MSLSVYKNGWRNVGSLYVLVGGVWKKIKNG
jgi:hypothetical protein